MLKKEVVKLIYLLTEDGYNSCTYKQSIEIDNKINSLTKFIEKIQKENGKDN